MLNHVYFIAIPTSGVNSPAPRRITKRRMGKAAPGNSGDLFRAGQAGNFVSFTTC